MSNKNPSPPGSVLLRRVGSAAIRLTPSNIIFVVYRGELYHPHLSGNRVFTDNKSRELPDKVLEVVRTLLRKQQAIRSRYWRDPIEDCFQWN